MYIYYFLTKENFKSLNDHKMYIPPHAKKGCLNFYNFRITVFEQKSAFHTVKKVRETNKQKNTAPQSKILYFGGISYERKNHINNVKYCFSGGDAKRLELEDCHLDRLVPH